MKHITPKQKRINKEANQMRRAMSSVHAPAIRGACVRCRKVGEHTLDCFITEIVTEILLEFGEGEYTMHAEGYCSGDSVRDILRKLTDAARPITLTDYLSRASEP